MQDDGVGWDRAGVVERLPEHRAVLITVPEDVAPLLGPRLEAPFRWWFRTVAVPRQLPGLPGVEVRELPAAGDARIARLIGRSADQAAAFPGDPAVRRWVVVEESGT